MMNEDTITLIAATGLLLACAVFGYMVGAARGRPLPGLFCGLLLGPVGVLLACFLPKEEKRAGTVRRPGAPTRRKRAAVPARMDPVEAWEARERAKNVLPLPEGPAEDSRE